MRKIVFLRKKCNIYCELNLTVLDPGKATIGTRLDFLYYTRENILISFGPGPLPKGARTSIYLFHGFDFGRRAEHKCKPKP